MPSKSGSMTNPMWEQSFHVMIPDLSTQVITIKVITVSKGQPEIVGENRIIATELCEENVMGRK